MRPTGSPEAPAAQPAGGAPLDGITVVALEQAVAGPFASRQLADLGARVIKVERPGGGDFARHYDATVIGMSSYFVWLNRGKESIVLDLEDQGDRELLDVMVARCDVLLSNLAPGALARRGLAPAALRRRYPRLITCTISGYGPGGPYSDKKAYDLLIQCETGFVSATGTPHEPCKAGVSIADIAAGMYAFSGVLSALYQRERSGVGAEVTVSMLEALGEWMNQPELFSRYGGGAPRRSGARHASIAPYGPFRTGEGDVFLAVQNEAEWDRLCRLVLRRPEMVHDPRFDGNPARVANVEALVAEIDAVFSGLSAGEVRARLEAAAIASGELRTVEEFGQHPQLMARDRWIDVDTPAGPVRTLRPPLSSNATAPRAVPALGEQSGALRQEFGRHRTSEG